MKKNIILFTILLWVATSCSYDYRLKNLNHRELTYEELPDSVRTLLYSSMGDIILNGLLFVNPSDTSVYRYEVVFYKIAPWVPAYCKLTDTNKNISYRIEKEVGQHMIIDSNTHNLYVPNNKDSYSINEWIFKETFTEYELK